jgi:hypothetical protein
MASRNPSRLGREFNTTTARLLGERVAYMCSKPDCRILTIKARSGSESVQKKGKACHIHSASPKGPRFDPEMSDKDCKSAANGIWLCDICAREVDDDASAYSAQTLKWWKNKSEVYVMELVTQDSRLRQLRATLSQSLSALRILSGIPQMGVTDITFFNAAGIPLARLLIEAEQILVENDFVAEAGIVQSIYGDLIRVQNFIWRGLKTDHCDISAWKNHCVTRIMQGVLKYSSDALNWYLKTENALVSDARRSLASQGFPVRSLPPNLVEE